MVSNNNALWNGMFLKENWNNLNGPLFGHISKQSRFVDRTGKKQLLYFAVILKPTCAGNESEIKDYIRSISEQDKVYNGPRDILFNEN